MQASKFLLTEISNFDARRGHKKFTPPGVTVKLPGFSSAAHAHIWRNRVGDLVVRCSSAGYRFSFAACMSSGKSIPDDAAEDISGYLSSLLFQWILDGVDDVPTTDV